jgi:hypothetical protein
MSSPTPALVIAVPVRCHRGVRYQYRNRFGKDWVPDWVAVQTCDDRQLCFVWW